ncbi:MAG: metallophosphoesterase [Spirochaetes bacterium]|nr:metallophosphoesterase [Spirochaetota bacterium]MBN2769736.1 metallophosphoesterase [Spirochaetota bacterium]
MTKYSILFILLALLSCDVPQNENYELDKEVGIASVDGAQVEVVSGLGVINNIEPGKLEIHQSAPQIKLVIDPGKSGISEWQIELSNSVRNTYALSDDSVTILSESQNGIKYSLKCEVPVNKKISIYFKTTEEDPVFAVFSDVQRAVSEVSDIFEAINSDDDLQFVLSTGDLTSNGTKSEIKRFIKELENLAVPFYTTMGNHDSFDSQYKYWHKVFGRTSFRFIYRDTLFVFLDSSSGVLYHELYDDLEGWLGLSDGLKIVLTHYPIVDPSGTRGGSFSSRNEAYKLLSLLGENGTDLLLFGHIHSYYKYTLAGIDCRISGGGGAMPERYDGIGRHYLKIEVDPDNEKYSIERVDID